MQIGRVRVKNSKNFRWFEIESTWFSPDILCCVNRASRNKHALLASQAMGTANSEECPGTITLQVRVPYRVVGLVVGPKGATIKRIQQQTHTYIVTPSRDKEPVFEVTGRHIIMNYIKIHHIFWSISHSINK